ncbi:Cilia- and flagella-associated protein isoform 1 [Schistosoma japonicum]|uniref:Cilia-and flagella-associated protein isoform 1 n=1 Tax=Schistosoma japonicum TaxID=6182 RepID=A0A4Z2DYD7_SCHJA|nr:Cilia- and flagella-associated protein isoform 1 [Schistosoma japonicum]
MNLSSFVVVLQLTSLVLSIDCFLIVFFYLNFLLTRETAPEQLQQDDKNNSINNDLEPPNSNSKILIRRQPQGSNLFEKSGNLELSNETYNTTDEEKNEETIHKQVDSDDEKSGKKAIVQNVESESEEELISSCDTTDSFVDKINHQTSRNSPVCQSPNKINSNEGKETRNASNPDIYYMNNEYINAAEIANALKTFDKKIRRLRIRPPWRDPNSKPLPSDRTIAFYNMYEDYLKFQNQRSVSSLNHSRAKFTDNEIAVHRLYHSTLNRLRQNEKIQIENYELAKRLQKIRPTTGMTREEQLRDYKKYFITPNSFYPCYKKSTFISALQNDFRVNHQQTKNNKSKNSFESNESTSNSMSKYH